MKSVLSELKKLYPDSELTLFDTSGGGYKKTDITESSNQATGMESSIIPFSQYNSIQSRLFPSSDDSKDPIKLSHNLAVDHIQKNVNPILKKSRRRRK